MEEVAVPSSEDPLKHLIISGKYFNGLSVGIKQSIRALECRDAQLCVLAGDCDDTNYVAIITALCKESKVPIYQFGDGQKKLGELLGLCKLDRDGKPRKVVRCSCFVVRNNAPSRNWLLHN
ncbi:hypothetical protein HZS_3921 [Henneguya salminicola]|nr:hypothetical protein HZS_3921 [Henneguya salminicola]